jgi:hypothetical protein
MNENKFWLNVWTVAALTLVAVVGISTLYWQGKNNLVADMVSKGANPIAASCSLDNLSDYTDQCIVYVATHK